ncbi:MAG: LysR family transcriptional regulator [Pseudomonadota bacterium]
MNLRQLDAFRATMQRGSITAASEALHISQPSVSRLISDLERSIGFSLFIRSGRGLTATAEARTFYQAVEDMFVGIDRLKELADAIKNTAGGVISVGVIQSIASIELPRAVDVLCRRHADVRFMIQCRNTPAILDAVQIRHYDIGIVGRQPPYAGVEVLFETSAPYVCLLPEEHPIVGEAGAVDLAELAETESFVTFGGAFPDEMMNMDQALSQTLRKNSRLSATNIPMAASLVRETGVLAIVDPFSAEQAVRIGGVAFRPIQQDLTYHIAVITRESESLPRVAAEFAEVIAAQMSERVRAVSKYAKQ